MAVFDPSRLYVSLLNTGLQQKDNPLYQVIHDLIGVALDINNNVNKLISAGGGTAGPQGIQGIQGLPGIDGESSSSDDTLIIPAQSLTSLFTQGSVIFIGPSSNYAQDNVKFFWDDTNFRLGIGTSVPVASLDALAHIWIRGGTGGGLAATAGPGVKIEYDVGNDQGFIQAYNYTTGVPKALILNSAGGFVGVGSSFAPTVPLDVLGTIRLFTSLLGTTSTDGVVLENISLSTALIPVQIAPRLRLRSHAWNTGSVSDNTDDWIVEPLPTSGATPSTMLRFGKSLNGGGYTYPLTVDNFGVVRALSSYTVVQFGAFVITSVGQFDSSPSGASGLFRLRNSAVTSGVGLDVTTDAVLAIRTRAHTGDASVSCLNYIHSGPEIDKTYQIYTPLTATTVTMSAGQSRAIINPAGLIAALTVTLPPSPVDGQVTGISFTQAVTVLTVNAPGGATVVASPTSAAIDTNLRFLYQASSTSWFPAS